MTDDSSVTGGTQRSDTGRDPDLPRTDDPLRGAQEQDDSSKATAGVQLPGGTKVEASTDGDQHSATLTIPFGGEAPKPVDTSPSSVNPDAPPDPGACVGTDGQSYPNGWEIFRNNVAIERCVNGVWVPVVPPASPEQPGDYESPVNPTTGVASNDASAWDPQDPSTGGSSDSGDYSS
jgi:hypothetical protein